MLQGVIFDVDGVLVASTQERAWRVALQEHIAGKLRLSGASGMLTSFDMPSTSGRAEIAPSIHSTSSSTAPGCQMLLDLFSATVCGRDLPGGKPHPAIKKIAADALTLPPSACAVAEAAPAGLQEAQAGGLAASGLARLNDSMFLQAAGADLVVDSLDRVSLYAVPDGRLECTPRAAQTNEQP